MIKYRLIDDPDNPGKKKPELIADDILDLEDILQELPGGFAMKDEYKKIIDLYFTTAFEMARKEGRTVDTPLIVIKPTGERDENGEYEVEVFPSEKLREAINVAKAEQVEGDLAPNPVQINFVHDLLSNTTNQYLTPGGIVEINGKYLKLRPYHGDKEKECLEFHSLESEKKITIENVLTNSAHKLVVELPENMPEEEGKFVITTGMFDDPGKQRPAKPSKKLAVKKAAK